MVKIIYQDEYIIVCDKPQGVVSTDEPGGLPFLLREQLGIENIRTVHRLDQVTGGLMVLAKRRKTASVLSEMIRSHGFQKKYLAVIHGMPEQEADTFCDVLLRDPVSRTTTVVNCPQKNARDAVLHYRLLSSVEEIGLSYVSVQLETGRTHQIRVQFASRGLPLVGDRKYGLPSDDSLLALWSSEISFAHPKTLLPVTFNSMPPPVFPWNLFIR